MSETELGSTVLIESDPATRSLLFNAVTMWADQHVNSEVVPEKLFAVRVFLFQLAAAMTEPEEDSRQMVAQEYLSDLEAKYQRLVMGGEE